MTLCELINVGLFKEAVVFGKNITVKLADRDVRTDKVQMSPYLNDYMFVEII